MQEKLSVVDPVTSKTILMFFKYVHLCMEIHLEIIPLDKLLYGVDTDDMSQLLLVIFITIVVNRQK
jgi:hypothetical protein